MKHSFWKPLAVAMALLLLTACAGTSGPNKAQSSDDAAPEVSGTVEDKTPVESEPEPAPVEPEESAEVSSVPESPNARPTLGVTFFNDYHYDEDLSMMVNSMEAWLVGADAATHETYQGLAVALDRFRADSLEDAQEAYQRREDALSEMSAEEILGPLNGTARSFVRRADEKVVSVVNVMNSYDGGPHEAYGFTTANFDSVSGEEITLESLLTDAGRAQLNDRIGAELDALYPSSSPGSRVAERALEEYSFTLEPDGVTFWFSQSEIASYAEGSFIVKLFFAQDADLFQSSYAGQEDAWSVELPEYVPYRTPDGDSLSYWGNASADVPDWYDSIGLLFSVAGEDTLIEDEYGGFNIHAYFVHIPEGNYLLLNNTMENDAQFVRVYGMDGKEVGEPLDLTGPDGFFYPTPPEDVEDWSDYFYYNLCLTDPYHLSLSTRLYLFGTWEGSGVYRLTPDGLQRETEVLYATSKYVLTLKQDLLVERLSAVDLLGVPTGDDFTLLAGTQVEAFASDGDNLTFFRVESDGDDDYIFGLSYDIPDEYPRTINGVEEEELFDGIMYAG